MIVAAAAADDGGPLLRGTSLAPMPLTGRDRALVARNVAGDELRHHFVCRTRVLELIERLVEQSVEAAERDLRERQREQIRCPN